MSFMDVLTGKVYRGNKYFNDIALPWTLKAVANINEREVKAAAFAVGMTSAEFGRGLLNGQIKLSQFAKVNSTLEMQGLFKGLLIIFGTRMVYGDKVYGGKSLFKSPEKISKGLLLGFDFTPTESEYWRTFKNLYLKFQGQDKFSSFEIDRIYNIRRMLNELANVPENQDYFEQMEFAFLTENMHSAVLDVYNSNLENKQL